jgi:hypothetical protein
MRKAMLKRAVKGRDFAVRVLIGYGGLLKRMGG